MAGQQRGARNPSQRGDFTGNKKEALAREHAEAVDARREEIGLISAGKAAVKDDGVIDLMGEVPVLDMGLGDPPLGDDQNERRAEGEPVTPSGLQTDAGGRPDDAVIHDALHGQPVDLGAREPYVAPQQPVSEPQGRLISDPYKSSYEVRELEPERPVAAMNATEALERDALNLPCEIRVLYDLEDVTIGYGNTWTFKEGYRYRVPRWVAAHLEEKQLAMVTNLTPA